jgi:iron complex transport system substrate-binding protein
MDTQRRHATSTATLAALLAAATLMAAPRTAGQRTPSPAEPAAASTAAPAREPDADARIVCVGGALTEIVFALGAGERVVAVDSGSTWPPEARDRSQLGYQRALSAEGVLALRPSLVLVTPDAGPRETLRQLRDAGVAVHVIPAEPSPEGALAKIAAVAQVLGRPAQGEALRAALQRDLDEARERLAQARSREARPPRVLCVYARSRGALFACGAGTPLDAMVALAGGSNALGDLRGGHPLGAESAVAATPDAIVMPAGSAEIWGGADALLADAGLQLTPAGRTQHVIALDDLQLTGFGPRMGAALVELVRALHEPATAANEAQTAPGADEPAPIGSR